MKINQCLVQLDECKFRWLCFTLNKLKQTIYFRFVLNKKSDILEQIQNRIKTCENDIKKQEVKNTNLIKDEIKTLDFTYFFL